ncbi:MAG: efflux RND transporter periplasmic adaptor subunit [Leptospiraceae bacterium]|nr:efflux RND transporter periplasmic adaptor subunit [Leptospiraceae bacterium]NUM42227.1 efflux RND transporter periplasmic adaptor subunit [Leptospiraceae bacterium]
MYFLYAKFKGKKKLDLSLNTESSQKIILPQDVLKKFPLSYVRIKERGIYEEIILPGVVSYDLENMAKVGSRVSGRVDEVYVKEGDYVTKGSSLASISSVELSRVEANFLKAKARLDAVKLQAERAKELFEKKIISAKEYELAMMEYKTVKTELDTNQLALETFGLSKKEIQELEAGKFFSRNLMLRSPIKGTVTDRKAILGQSVSIKENLFTVANLTKLWILLDVYEKDLHSVRIGAEAFVHALGNRDEEFKARVAYVGDVIDSAKKTAEIRLEVSNKENRLRPGQSVSAKVQGLISESKSRKILVVPASALHKIENKPILFIANMDGSFEAREVVAGDFIDGDVEIKSGVSVDANIVNEGSFLLKSEYLK